MQTTLLGKLSLAAKVLELTLACACVALYDKSYKLPYHLLLPITFGGYVIIVAVLVAGVLASQRVSRLVDIMFSVVGMVLFVAAGSLAVKFHKQPNGLETGMAMGSLAIINGFVFLVDVVVVYRDVHEYTPQ